MTESHDGAAVALYARNARNPKRRLFIWRAIIFILPALVIVGAIALVVILGALKEKPETKEDVIKAVPVLTALAVQDDVTLRVSTQGEVQPRTEINIVPQVGGRISDMSPNFIAGGQFKKGDVLFRIEARDYELRVVQARANVAQAQTVLMREKTESAIALEDWNDIGRGRKASALTLREPQMAEAQARLASAEAQLDEAELQLSRTVVRAPFTGRVTTRNVDQGEFVNPGTAIGRVYADDVMDVRLPLTNDELRRAGLQIGYQHASGDMPITVDLSANVGGTDATWQGQIVRTDSRYDAATRVLYAYAEVRDPFGAGSDNGVPIAPGLFVSGAIGGETFENVITVPRAALRGNNQVFIANDDDTLSIKTVQVISTDRDRAVIRSGLSIGDAVVTSPIRGASDGMEIAVVDNARELGPQISEDSSDEDTAAEAIAAGDVQ
ncbi:efflux RND transporter periplasmic adaptor subunit [Fretibacter rubidus]|uniref:efflux RND transporter periplasmic adaptor subunit n=1 Tax=Fretibacter rubidus TaxID=570162 RepID=UPI00352A2AD4